MKRTLKPMSLGIASLMATAALLSACASGSEDADTAASGEDAAQPAMAQMANPAAVFCIEQGGEHIIRKDEEGNEVGYCALPDGQEMIAWDYYRQMHPPVEEGETADEPATAPEESADADPSKAETPKVAIANPSATFCIEQGGTYDIRKDSDGAAYGICILPDGSEVNAWEYFRKMNS